jgi:hypothetical protein
LTDPWEARHFPVNDLDGPVDQPLLDTLLENQIERLSQIFVEVRLGKTPGSRKSIR